MALSANLLKHFDSQTKLRGLDYFRRGLVLDVEDSGDGVIAYVEGSGDVPYEVFLKHNDPDLEAVECTCPRFADGWLCKHIVAALLHVQCRGGSKGKANRQPAAPAPWRKLLREVAEISDGFTNGSAVPFSAAVKKRTEVWYVLNVGATLAEGKLAVDLAKRETNKNGEFGKFKSLTVRREDIEGFSLAEDRTALGLLLGNQPHDAYSAHYRFGYGGYGPGASRVLILPALFGHVLPTLAATGRFVWVLERDVGVEAGRPVVWDDGPPWRFRLNVEDDAKAKCYRIRGELCRGQAVRPLDAAVMVHQGGIVLWEDALARLESADFPWMSVLRRHSRIEIPHAARDELLRQLWTGAQAPAGELSPSLQLEQVHVPPRGRLKVHKESAQPLYRARDELFARLSWEYGDQRIPCSDPRQAIVDPANRRVLVRDREAEARLTAELGRLQIRPTTQYERSDGDVKFAKSRLGEIVAALVKAGWLVEADGRLIRSAGSVNISVTSGVDWFELGGEVDFDGISASLPDLLAAIRKGEKFVRLGDGSQGMLPEEWLKKYGGLVELGEAEGSAIRFRPTQALLLDALLAAQENVTVDRGFRDLRRRLAKFDGIKPRSAPRGFQGELRDYQKQGLGWLLFLQDFQFGGCLADDMGLGKTVQVLALLDARRTRRPREGEARSPSLVVVPKSLVFNWIEEAQRFTPKLRVLNYTGTQRKQMQQDLTEHDVVVTTYGTLRKDIAGLKDTRFDYAILDEAQAIKNAGSQAAKACRLIQADHRLAMTGTPVENHLGELWSLFEFLNPGLLGRSAAASSLLKSAGKGEAQSLEFLRRALAPYVLRRTKEQVLKELPEKTEQTLYCEMAPKQRKQYNELRDYYRALLQDRIEELGLERAKIHVLEALLRLRQAACHPGLLDKKQQQQPSAKLEVLLEQVAEIIDEGHKALVFSQFTSLLAIVRKELDARKIRYEYLDGRTHNRKEKVKKFQEDPACPLFLISLKAGGHGLNLTAADYVYILDPWWNPAVEAQAVDRAHRIGQSRRVFAYRLICRDTVEEKIVELQQKKRDLADAIISADSSVLRRLTAEDLQLLLS